jgi:uncharacterized NAD(P)/FAD-binding protein YdhS
MHRIGASHVHVQHRIRRCVARQCRNDAGHRIDETLQASHSRFRRNRAMSAIGRETLGRRPELERFRDLAGVEIRIATREALWPAGHGMTTRFERHRVDDGDGGIVSVVATQRTG